MAGMLINPYISFPAAGGDPVADFNSVAHASFDLTAEGFSDSTAIGTLTDQTGNGRDATQTTAAKKPTAQTVSGMKVARFDGSDDYLQTTSWTATTQPNTMVALFKWDDATSSGFYAVYDGISGSNRHSLYSATGTWRYNAGVNEDSGVTDDSDWHVAVAVFDGTSSTLYLDGVSIATSSSGTQPGTDSLTGLSIGARHDGANLFWDGDVNFVGMYDGDLVTDDLTLLNDLGDELATRAGITWTDIV